MHAARLERQRHMALHRKAFAPGVVGLGKSRGRIAADRAVADREIAAVPSNSRVSFACRLVAVGHRRQRLDVDTDQVERVLGDRRAVGQHDRDRLADIADLAVGDDRLVKGFELRQRLQPDRDPRHRARPYRPR